jgi:hypothetical protein
MRGTNFVSRRRSKKSCFYFLQMKYGKYWHHSPRILGIFGRFLAFSGIFGHFLAFLALNATFGINDFCKKMFLFIADFQVLRLFIPKKRVKSEKKFRLSRGVAGGF